MLVIIFQNINIMWSKSTSLIIECELHIYRVNVTSGSKQKRSSWLCKSSVLSCSHILVVLDLLQGFDFSQGLVWNSIFKSSQSYFFQNNSVSSFPDPAQNTVLIHSTSVNGLAKQECAFDSHSRTGKYSGKTPCKTELNIKIKQKENNC